MVVNIVTFHQWPNNARKYIFKLTKQSCKIEPLIETFVFIYVTFVSSIHVKEKMDKMYPEVVPLE